MIPVRALSCLGHMARKIQRGEQTQTRDVITAAWARCLDLDDPDDCAAAIEQAPHKVGDVLWLREPLLVLRVRERPWANAIDVKGRYDADGAYTGWGEFPADLDRPKPGTHVANGCPREFSRANVRVTRVRVERLSDISRDDALAEGVDVYPGRDGSADRYRNYLNGDGYCTSPIGSFQTLWESINGADRVYGWGANPTVFAYTFALCSLHRPEAM